MNRKTKTLILLLVTISLLSLLRVVGTNAESNFPVLVWDVAPPTFVGKEFVVIFTCFSDSSTTIHVEILLDDIDLEWTANAPYFVNHEVLINTEDQLAGVDHKLELIATDYSNRTKTLTSIFIIDSIDPVFNSLNVYPMEEDKIVINKDTELMVEWNISDNYFYEFHVYKTDDPSPLLRSPDKIGKWNYTYLSRQPSEFTITCLAMDEANNTAERTFDVSYLVEEGEFIPIEEHEEEIEQIRRDQRIQVWAGIFGFIAGIPILISIFFVVRKILKEMHY